MNARKIFPAKPLSVRVFDMFSDTRIWQDSRLRLQRWLDWLHSRLEDHVERIDQPLKLLRKLEPESKIRVIWGEPEEESKPDRRIEGAATHSR